jgi:hypothetical protein
MQQLGVQAMHVGALWGCVFRMHASTAAARRAQLSRRSCLLGDHKPHNPCLSACVLAAVQRVVPEPLLQGLWCVLLSGYQPLSLAVATAACLCMCTVQTSVVHCAALCAVKEGRLVHKHQGGGRAALLISGLAC